MTKASGVIFSAGLKNVIESKAARFIHFSLARNQCTYFWNHPPPKCARIFFPPLISNAKWSESCQRKMYKIQPAKKKPTKCTRACVFVFAKTFATQKPKLMAVHSPLSANKGTKSSNNNRTTRKNSIKKTNYQMANGQMIL